MYGERRKPGLQKKRSKTKPENSKKADKYDIIEPSTSPEETAGRSLSEDLGKYIDRVIKSVIIGNHQMIRGAVFLSDSMVNYLFKVC
jgi:hypothetical protein